MLLVLCSFPSFELTRVSFAPWPGSSAEILKVSPGSVTRLAATPEIQNARLNNSLLEPIGNAGSQFFIAGVYGGSHRWLQGEMQSSQSWTSGWLSHPTQTVARQLVQVQLGDRGSGGTLRLPASVQKRLSEVEEHQRMVDRNLFVSALETDPDAQKPMACWNLPIRSKITSDYGRARRLPSGRSYYHAGVDLRAPIGAPIRNASPGKVVYAGFMTVPGNNVIIAHGDGLFSRYMHLDKIEVQVGDTVDRGVLIGRGGDTGRVEAPHLHWEIIWRGQYADPIQFVEAFSNFCS